MSQRPPSSKDSKKSTGPKGSVDPKLSAIATVGGAAPGIPAVGPGGPGRPAAGSAPGGTAKKGPPDTARKAPSDPARKATSDAGKTRAPSKTPGFAPVPPRAPFKQSSLASSKSTDDGYEQGKAARDARLGKAPVENAPYMHPPNTAERSGSVHSRDSKKAEAPAGRPAGPPPARGESKFEIGPRSESPSSDTHTSDYALAEAFVQEMAQYQREAMAGIQRDQRLKGLPTATHSRAGSDNVPSRGGKIVIPSIPGTRERERAVRGESESSIGGSPAGSSSSGPSEINLRPHEKSTESAYATEDADDPVRRVRSTLPQQMPPPGPTTFVPIDKRPGKPGSRQTTGSSGRSYRSTESASSIGDSFEEQGREMIVSRPPTRPPTPASPIALKQFIPAVGKHLCKSASEQMAEELKDYRDMLTVALVPAVLFCGPKGWKEEAEDPANHHLLHATMYEAAMILPRKVVKQLYATELVREYDCYVTESRGGQKGSWFKRLSEDDALRGVPQHLDTERYPNWHELQGFLTWEKNRYYGKLRQEIFDRMVKDNVNFAVAEKRIRENKTKMFMGSKAY